MNELRLFTLMPFLDDFDDVYLVVRDSVGLSAEQLRTPIRCLRADEIGKPGKITDQILAEIRECDAVVADLTGNNPNVMYELGWAHALEKPVIILNQDIHQTAFDVKDFRQIIYDRQKLVKDCRPRLVSALCDVFAALDGDDSSEARDSSDDASSIVNNPSPSSSPTPLRLSNDLLVKLQSLHVRLESAGMRGDSAARDDLAHEFLGLLDRMIVGSAYSNRLMNNVAGVVGNCAVELEKQGLDTDAESAYRRAIGLFPDHSGLHLQYCDYLIDQDRVDEAKSELERARELDPDHERIRREEMRLLFSGSVLSSTAIESIKAEFEGDAGNKELAAAYLTVLDRTGAPIDEVRSVTERWMQASPAEEKWRAKRSLADFLADTRVDVNRLEAKGIYEELLLDDSLEDRASVLHNLATINARMHNEEEALRCWSESYELNRFDPVVKAAFSQFLMSNNLPDLAIRVIESEPLED